MHKKTLFSAIQPTGELHIGNYLGALKQWGLLQDEYSSIFAVADFHSITEDFNPKEKQKQVFETVCWFLACGIDPKKAIIFVQSHLPEHTELTWILNCITPITELERMTQYKDKAQRQKHNINMGLFDYPVLMAADILLYQTDVVPVGEDQVQHVELSRVIAKKFNNKFGGFFNQPEAKLTKTAKVMSLTNSEKKMSKSLGEKSYIALADSESKIENKIKSAVTGDRGGRNLICLLEEFSGDEKLIKKFQNQYDAGTIKYAELKPVLAQNIIQALKPLQEKYEKISKDKKYVIEILEQGAAQAHKIAEKNLKQIKKLIGVL